MRKNPTPDIISLGRTAAYRIPSPCIPGWRASRGYIAAGAGRSRCRQWGGPAPCSMAGTCPPPPPLGSTGCGQRRLSATQNTENRIQTTLFIPLGKLQYVAHQGDIRHTQTHTYRHTHTDTRTHTHTQTHTHTDRYTTHRHTHIDTHTDTHRHTQTHTDRYTTHRHTHIDTHTYRHTHI